MKQDLVSVLKLLSKEEYEVFKESLINFSLSKVQLKVSHTQYFRRRKKAAKGKLKILYAALQKTNEAQIQRTIDILIENIL